MSTRARNIAIVAAAHRGESLTNIALAHRISRQRVWQIVHPLQSACSDE